MGLRPSKVGKHNIHPDAIFLLCFQECIFSHAERYRHQKCPWGCQKQLKSYLILKKYMNCYPAAQQVRTKQEEVDHKEEVLAVLLERYALSAGTAVPDNPVGQSHANLSVAGPIRQGSLTALSKASLAPSTDSKGPGARPTAGDVKRLGSSRGRLDIKVTSPPLALVAFGC